VHTKAVSIKKHFTLHDTYHIVTAVEAEVKTRKSWFEIYRSVSKMWFFSGERVWLWKNTWIFGTGTKKEDKRKVKTDSVFQQDDEM
jgi:hypothetical protein